MGDEKQTYRTEVPFILTLARAVLDVNEVLVGAARRMTEGMSQSFVFSCLRAWMTALQDELNSVQVLQLSQTLENLLAEQVDWVDQYRIEFGERYLELKD